MPFTTSSVAISTNSDETGGVIRMAAGKEGQGTLAASTTGQQGACVMQAGTWGSREPSAMSSEDDGGRPLHLHACTYSG